MGPSTPAPAHSPAHPLTSPLARPPAPLTLLPLLPPPLLQGTESALIAVHIQLGRLPEAQRIYRELRAAGTWPHPYAMNALINAYANNFRCGGGGGGVCVGGGLGGGGRKARRGVGLGGGWGIEGR